MSDGKIDEGPSEAHFYQFAIEGVAQSIVGLLGLIGKVCYFIFMKNVNAHTWIIHCSKRKNPSRNSGLLIFTNPQHNNDSDK